MSYANQFGKLFSAHLKMMFREKQVWFWNIFFPVILMVLFMIIFGGNSGGSFKASIAVVEPQANSTSQMLLEQLRRVPVFEWKSEQPVSLEQGDKWVKDKDVDALIVLPETESANTMRLIVNKEEEKNSTTMAVAGILDKFVQQSNLAVAGATPAFELKTESVSSGSADLKYEDFLLTGMIALSVAQGGLFGMVDMVEMRRKGMLTRLRLTPVKMGLFGLAGMTVRMVLGVIQIVLLTLIGVFGFGANLHLDIASLIIVFLIGTLAFNAIGYLFASFSKSLESYMGLANIASFLMMFLSGIFFAASSLPEWLHPVTKVLPLTYFVDGMRDGMVYGRGVASGAFWTGIGILALWGAVTFVIGSQLFRRQAAVRS
ncbi:ABC transporter permease [Paenibacillus beijingensis]|uniref:Transport permease protein n=1 Tax=Paenibacillus beijingensis TaxID=1126833 RepID=A0A0D5NGE7_9BACL|nr:ABC transporter permease [Paenibacillus beijingensis]AJY74185.1 ABC transporter [Paenibacillus beijingensis]